MKVLFAQRKSKVWCRLGEIIGSYDRLNEYVDTEDAAFGIAVVRTYLASLELRGFTPVLEESPPIDLCWCRRYKIDYWQVARLATQALARWIQEGGKREGINPWIVLAADQLGGWPKIKGKIK